VKTGESNKNAPTPLNEGCCGENRINFLTETTGNEGEKYEKNRYVMDDDGGGLDGGCSG